MSKQHFSKVGFKRTLLSTLISIQCFGAYAAVDAEKEKAPSVDDVEVIEIKGIKGNLESALNAKKSSPTIVDGISSDDIGSLPALDMGEALQAVAGVQLNREGERRESSINLRGLPSGFVLTTANGQAIATPTRNSSASAYGAGNPFGAFNPAVFSGIKVVKSLSAEMPEGGISGIVDQGIRGALSRKDSLTAQVGFRHEELADSMDPEFVLSGSTHLIKDVLAVNGTLAFSEQTFRQDAIRINAYDTISNKQYDQGNGAGTFSEWKAAQGLPSNAIVQMPGEYRQQSEVNTGDRLSFAGGIEFQATEQLKLGANVILTSRDLDGSRLEQLEMRLDQSTVGITPRADSAPRDTGSVGTNGEPIYTLSAVDFNNPRYYFDNRQDAQQQDSNAYLFDAEWRSDDWIVDAAVTLSDAVNQRAEVLLSSRVDNSGITGTVYTGEGDIGDFYFDMEGAEGSMDWDNAVWSVKDKVANTALVGSKVDGVSNVYMIITGNYEQVEHEANSVEFNAEHMLDNPFIQSIKFGYRFAESSQDSTYAKGSSVGVDPTGVLTNASITDPSYVNEEAFFGGLAPGFVTAADGWRSFDFASMNQGLRDSIDINNVGDSSDGETAVLTPMGYIQRGGRQADGYIYSSSLETHALYLMANLEVELGDSYLTGNVGGRYIDSSTESRAPLAGQGDINNLDQGVYPEDYSHFLPSINLAMNLDQDEEFMVRMAYNESIVRPDLRAANPSAKFKYIPGLAEVGLPGVGIKPFEADSLDFSFEWYNREGSAITLAVFNKEISNLFDNEGLCNSDALVGTGVNLGSLSQQADGTCITDGNDNLSDATLLVAGDEVRMSGLINIEDTISVSGYELSIQQNLDFLPYPFNGLGGVLNYSNTSQDEDDDARVPGISDETYNAIAYYEEDDFGIRIAYNYRTAYDLRTTGTANGSGDRSVKAAGRLDLSAYYNVNEKMSVSFKAYNLTDTLYEEYQNNEWMPRSTKFGGRVYAVNAKYKF
ncbi:TonB-dependent receptor [Psychrosphaera aquimarina]|uniref:TonB-dependent receptor n=1 Tax=Psychrosphaera aquimarina TaxID=2044854 RepID=A0ABU3R276_9GAMM|nr:TonB-dependent receptor [Psychrosphaera aquimarina]MDU0113777.1 TonB-dependent receptor [Psychrosphaera aquimarina]